MSGRHAFLARSIQLAFVLIVLGVWHFATRSGEVHAFLLPPLPAVWKEMGNLASSGALLAAARVTAAEVATAFAIAATAGIAAGFLIGRSSWLVRLLEPVLSGFFAIPITLFFPLFVLFFGIGPGSKIAYGAAYAFFPIALNTIAGFANVERRLVEALRAMGATPVQQIRHLYLPAARPVIVTGLRIGFFICFASVLGGETLQSAAGFGRAIANSAELMETARMYAWIVFVVLTTLSLNLLALAAETKAPQQ